MSDDVEVRPASTVVLLRDTDDGLETLLLKRNKALLFAGGAWVFPGGALDPEDFAGAEGDVVAASRVAAAREAQEESGLQPHLEDMVLLSHWTTPVGEPRRFSTWIYAAPLAIDEDVVIDGGEIHDSRWINVRQATAEHEAGELGMLPPTYITLCNLARYDTVEQMVAVERSSPVPEVFPVFTSDGDQVVVLFRGDAGYDSGDGSVAGIEASGRVEGRVLAVSVSGCRPGISAVDASRGLSSAVANKALALWDIPTRVFHWAIVVCVGLSWLSGEFERYDIHEWSGYAVIVLVLARICWGFVGSVHSRFADFLVGPSSVRAYFRDGVTTTPGHNPLGGWSVMLLLALLLLQGFSGLFNTDDVLFSGPLYYWADGGFRDTMGVVHEMAFNGLLTMIILHLLAVSFYQWRRGQKLIQAMIRGSAPGKEGRVAPVPWWPALLIAVALALALWWGLAQAPQPQPMLW